MNKTLIKRTKTNSFRIAIEKKCDRNKFAICCHKTKNSKKKKYEKNKTKSKTRKHNKFKTNFQNLEKKKIVDSNMNFMNKNIFQKRFQIMNKKFFFSSFRSLSLISVNSYKEISSDDALNFSKSNSESTSNIKTLNSLNFFELNFQSISNRRDVLILYFRIFNSRINFKNQNIQSSSFDIICRRAELEYITSKNIFIRSQSFFSRSSFFFNRFFRVFHFSIEIH